MNDFLIQLDDFHIQLEDKRIIELGFENWFNNQLNIFLNLCKDKKPNERISILDLQYKQELSTTKYFIEKYSENIEQDLKLLEEQHNKNIEYEKQNPITYIPKQKIKRTKNKQTSIEFETYKPKVLDLSLLTIKIKAKENKNE